MSDQRGQFLPALIPDAGEQGIDREKGDDGHRRRRGHGLVLFPAVDFVVNIFHQLSKDPVLQRVQQVCGRGRHVRRWIRKHDVLPSFMVSLPSAEKEGEAIRDTERCFPQHGDHLSEVLCLGQVNGSVASGIRNQRVGSPYEEQVQLVQLARVGGDMERCCCSFFTVPSKRGCEIEKR